MTKIRYSEGYYGNSDKVELTELTFNKDDKNYYLSAKFRVEDKHSIREFDIPKIRLNINPAKVSITVDYDPCCNLEQAYVDLGFGNLPMEFVDMDGKNVRFVERIIEEKYTEMTIDEIEKKLGHKIKIVNG